MTDTDVDQTHQGGCKNCYFGGGSIHSIGPKDATIVIVGEGLEILDLVSNSPLASSVGKFVKDVLKLTLPDSIELDDILFTYAHQCVARNKTSTRSARAAKRCRGRLFREIEAYPRKLIIGMGAVAIQSLTGDTDVKITQIRGDYLESPLAEYGILAVVHPNYLMRVAGNAAQNLEDFRKGFELVAGKPLVDNGNSALRYHVYEDVGEVHDRLLPFLKKLPEGHLLGCDAETSALHYMDGRILCLGIATSDDFVHIIRGKDLFSELFTRTRHLKWGWHNGKFDIRWIREHVGYADCVRVDADSMLQSYALNEVGGIHDLETVGHDWLGLPSYKDMLKPYLPNKKTSYEVIPEDVLHKYLAFDCGNTRKIIGRLDEELEKAEHSDSLQLYHTILIPASEYLTRVEANGIFVNQELVQKNADEMQSEADGLEAEFHAHSISDMGKVINLRSWQQLKSYFYEHLQLAPMSWKTDIKAMTKLSTITDHPAVAVLMKYRKIAKGLSTYVTPMQTHLKEDGRVHPSFKLHGTTTGRLACSEPNSQNIPRLPKLRGQFIAPEGYILLEVDLGQAELRSLAENSQDEVMLSIFNSDHMSLHDEMAIFLFGEGFDSEDKMAAKAVNFGIVYGRTKYSLAEEFLIALKEAARWINTWFERFPQAATYIEACREVARYGGTIITCFGRKRRFPIVSAKKLTTLQNEAANFPHQANASDITLLAGIILEPTLSRYFGVRVVNTVHDCMVMEVPTEDPRVLHVVAKLVTTVMSQIPKEYGLLSLEFESDAEVGSVWGSLDELHIDQNMVDEYMLEYPKTEVLKLLSAKLDYFKFMH